jgi:hypothetical protein
MAPPQRPSPLPRQQQQQPEQPPKQPRVFTAREVEDLAGAGRFVYVCEGRVFDVDADALMHPGGRAVRRQAAGFGGLTPASPRASPRFSCPSCKSRAAGGSRQLLVAWPWPTAPASGEAGLVARHGARTNAPLGRASARAFVLTAVHPLRHLTALPCIRRQVLEAHRGKDISAVFRGAASDATPGASHAHSRGARALLEGYCVGVLEGAGAGAAGAHAPAAAAVIDESKPLLPQASACVTGLSVLGLFLLRAALFWLV